MYAYTWVIVKHLRFKHCVLNTYTVWPFLLGTVNVKCVSINVTKLTEFAMLDVMRNLHVHNRKGVT